VRTVNGKNRGMGRRWMWIRRQGLAVREALLTVVTVVVFALVGPVAYGQSGESGLWAAAAAAAVCLAGASVALAVGECFRSPERAVIGLGVSMAPRMGIPLGFALWVHLAGGVLAESGFLYYLVVFYAVTLAVETSLWLPPGERSSDVTSNDSTPHDAANLH